MAGYLERLPNRSYLLRMGGPDCQKRPDPYDWTGVVIERTEGGERVAEICGVDKPVSIEQAKEIRSILIAAGFTRATWRRCKDGCCRHIAEVT